MKAGVRNNLLLLLGFAAVSIGGMEFLAVNIGQPSPLGSDYVLHASFPDADGVPTAADVAVDGVLVGRVTAVKGDRNQSGTTVVTMAISNYNAVPIYSDGTAVVRPKTLLGEKYVDLTRGTQAGSPIPSGGYLPAGQGMKSVSNDEIFNAMDAQTRASTQQALNGLDAATAGRAGDVRDILPNLNTTIADLVPVARIYAQDQPQVDTILVNLNKILSATADENEQLSGLLANGNVALSAIAQRDQALIGTLQEGANVANEFNAAAAPTVGSQRQALTQLGPTLQSVNAFLNATVGPQAVCGGQSCGIAEVFTGTVTGNVGYPNDQLTVSSGSGETTTNEWASMFSPPSPGGLSALNLVLSFHCDTIAQTLGELNGALSAEQQAQIQSTCQTANGHNGASLPAAAGLTAPNPGVLLLEGEA